MVKPVSWSVWEHEPHETPADDINPATVAHASLAEAQHAFISSPGVLLDALTFPPDDGAAIAEAITNGTAAAISDGSFDPVLQRGSSAFLLSPKVEENAEASWISGGNLTTGLPSDQSSYRSELAGAIAILSTVDLLVSFYHITSGALTIAFDGKAALDYSSSDAVLSVSQQSFDYLQVIHTRAAALPIDIHWRWVKGHQRELGCDDIDWWGRGNEWTDSKAKAFLTHAYRGTNPRPLFTIKLFYEPWTISLNSKKQTCVNPQRCYETLFQPRVSKYWENHHDIPIPRCSDIDWVPSSKAINRLPLGLKRWQWKFSTECIGVGNQLLHRKHQTHSKCPLCQANNKKVSHVLHCPDTAATAYATTRI